MTGDENGTEVSVQTDLSITGKVAQFGRGVLADVSAKLLGQFVERLEADVLERRRRRGERTGAGARPSTSVGVFDGIGADDRDRDRGSRRAGPAPHRERGRGAGRPARDRGRAGGAAADPRGHRCDRRHRVVPMVAAPWLT